MLYQTLAVNAVALILLLTVYGTLVIMLLKHYTVKPLNPKCSCALYSATFASQSKLPNLR